MIVISVGYQEDFLGFGLSARKNMCIHPRVSKLEGKAVDAGCHSMTASWVRVKALSRPSNAPELCSYFEAVEEQGTIPNIPSGVYTLESLKEYGRTSGQCPYFLSRRLLVSANVVIYSYYYLLDPKVADLVSRELARESIVVFDEAHNIDNVCCESMSIDLTPQSLEAASRSLTKLEEKVEDISHRDKQKLQDEYIKLVEGLKETKTLRDTDAIMANPILPDDILKEAIPGNIRKAEHFLSFLRRLLEFLRSVLRTQHVISESTVAFLTDLRLATYIERRPLKLCSERLSSLTTTLEMTNIDELAALGKVAAFATLVATYETGFLVLFEPVDEVNDETTLHLVCLDATVAIRPVLDRFQSVVITSGTLSPLSMYPRVLDFDPVLAVTLPNTLFRSSINPLIVTRGADQNPLSSRFEVRNDPAVVRNYGLLLVDIARITPDGVVGFFPSYLYMHHIIGMWQEMGILADLTRHKLLFIETVDGRETARSLEGI